MSKTFLFQAIQFSLTIQFSIGMPLVIFTNQFNWIHTFPKGEMQSVSSRIWTRVAVSISYDDIHYTTGIGMPLVLLNQ